MRNPSRDASTVTNSGYKVVHKGKRTGATSRHAAGAAKNKHCCYKVVNSQDPGVFQAA
jgi:hypothetical protein